MVRLTTSTKIKCHIKIGHAFDRPQSVLGPSHLGSIPSEIYVPYMTLLWKYTKACWPGRYVALRPGRYRKEAETGWGGMLYTKELQRVQLSNVEENWDIEFVS